MAFEGLSEKLQGALRKMTGRGKLTEAFGTGTAAVISPVGELCLDGEKLTIGGGKIGPVAQKLYDTLTGIQYGRLPDENHWVMKI